MTTQAIGGVRVSTDIQADKYGPARQRQDIMREAERQGLVLNEWVEEAISGTDHERAAVNRYYELAQQHPGINVIFSHPNRVGRHVEVTVGIARQLHALGATVWIAGMGSLRDKRNWRYFLRDAADAEVDHGEIVERLQRGKLDKALANRWAHGAAPFGYVIVRDERGKAVTLAPHPEYAAAVKRIFALTLNGLGSTSIAFQLMQDGVQRPRVRKSKHADRWSHRAVLYILRNEAYTGRREVYGPDGQVAVVTFPELVSTADFQAAQQQVERWNRNKRPAHTRWPALFAGHARCSLCEGGFGLYGTQNTAKNGKVTAYVMYRCRNTYSGKAHAAVRGGQVCTHNRTHRMEKLDEAGWQMVINALSSNEFLLQASTIEAPQKGPNHSGRIAELRQQMASALGRAVAHNLPDDVLQAALEPLQKELAALERANLKALAAAPAPDMSELAAAMADYLPSLQSLEERREVLDTWQIQLHVGPEGPEHVSAVIYRK